MAIDFLVLLLALLTMVNYSVARSVLYPPFVFTALWCFVLAVYRAHVIETDPLQLDTCLLTGMGAVLFSVGGLLALSLPSFLVTTKIVMRAKATPARPGSLARYALIGILFLGMIFFARATFIAGAAGSGATLLERARNAAVDAEQGGVHTVTLLTYVPVWSAYAAVLFLIEKKKKPFLVMTGIAFVTAIFTTGRGPVLLLFSSLAGAYLITTKRMSLVSAFRILRLPLLVFAALFIGLIFTNKDASTVEGGALGLIVYFGLAYFVTPVAALNYVLSHPAQYANESHHTFKFFLQIFASLNVIQYTPPPFLDAFVTVPVPTNVYTGYKFFYTDFGFTGCLAAVLLIGLLHTLLYRKALTGSELGIYCFSCSLYPLIMFIFDDLYSALGMHLNMLMFGCVYFLLRPLRLLSPRLPKGPIQCEPVL